MFFHTDPWYLVIVAIAALALTALELGERKKTHGIDQQ